MRKKYNQLKQNITGDVVSNNLHKIIYATDASVYRQKPLAVVYPHDKNDVVEIVKFAKEHAIPVIPRGAGTSLCGQVVGSGLVIDFTKYMNKILSVDTENMRVTVQPGVVLDELNKHIEKYGLFFGPETSTANRCVIGGMLGNNACGAHSIIYGSTRDHTHSIEAVLSNGDKVTFEPIPNEEFEQKCTGNALENNIYRYVNNVLSDIENQLEIRSQYPNKAIRRRNTGYALDELLNCEPFTQGGSKFNMSKIIAGSEGTLAIASEITLNLVPLPPKHKGLLVVHFHSLNEAFKANLIALKYNPGAIELIDRNILDCTKNSIEHRKNRFFLKDNPAALLVIEFARSSENEIVKLAKNVEENMRQDGYGYHFPLLKGNEINKVWALRKAGLGLLANIPGDSKAVTLIEDTAVKPEDMPRYMDEFAEILKKYNLNCVYHAHIGSGELHLRPMLNLKKDKDVEIFRNLGEDIAHLVKKYRGSLSGEHGDGRLRTTFIPIILGKKNYQKIMELKRIFDPLDILNPGKITNAAPMTQNLRYKPGHETKQIDTIFDFSSVQGIIRAAEKCNGSGDCRKSEVIGGTMCPSFMATRDERNTTRARANTLREILTQTEQKNPFDNTDLYDVMDLCLSCKGCKAECPSAVDMAKLKAEFLQHYYYAHNVPLRTTLIANISKINKLGSLMPAVTNFMLKNSFFSAQIKSVMEFAAQRQMPLLSDITLKKWQKKRAKKTGGSQAAKTLYLFADEFTNYNDSHIGIKTIQLLVRLGYNVLIPNHLDSGRTYISKGLLQKARKLANRNVELLSNIVSKNTPLIGIEPSAILSFRDEYTELVSPEYKEKANELSGAVFTIEEFLWNEIKAGKINRNTFTKNKKTIRYHGHCQQKAIASTEAAKGIMSFPVNYSVDEIKSGCCGMAGAFGYEKEHYELSMKIGELVLFPEIRKTSPETLLTASGTSCRHQIKDGTNREALHPVEILYDALSDKQGQ